MAGSASAFEVVDWNWTANIVEDWDIDVVISVDYDPTGIVKIEKLQMHFGDVNSFAKVFGIENNPPADGDGDGQVTLSVDVDGNIAWNDVAPAGGTVNPLLPGATYIHDNPDITITELPGGNADEDGNELDFRFHIEGEFDVTEIGAEPLALAALPEVVNAATSVANNQQIVSSSALMLHDAQIAAGDINPIGGTCDNECGEPDPIAFLIAAYLLTEVDDELEGLNEHTDIAALTILGAATGFIEPADIDADAWAFGITNATVDNSATAVGNNASYEIDTTDAANAIMVADLTQLLIGDVNAVALAGGISINNYDLTDIDTPIVNNVATAVGNNLNIKVGVGESE
jgi:hypothetical protein